MRSTVGLWAIAAAAALTTAAPAAAQTELACADAAVEVVEDAFTPAFAIVRAGPNGLQIAVNSTRAGLGLGRQTKDFLLARACALAAAAGDNPRLRPDGTVDYTLIQHQEADCAAYKAIAEQASGGRNALNVIDRDVSVQSRGTYWDAGMGQPRNLSAEFCLGG